MSLQHGELRPTSGWDRLAGFGHPSKFQGVLCLGFITAATSLNRSHPNFARCLAICWTGILYLRFWGLLPGILPGAKFTLRPSLAFSYIGSITECRTALEQWASATQRMELRNFHFSSFSTKSATCISRAAITLGIGPHSSCVLWFFLVLAVTVNIQHIQHVFSLFKSNWHTKWSYIK